MGEHAEIDFATAFDTGAEALADSIVGLRSPPLGQLLRDPVISAVMEADGVPAEALTALMRDTAAKLGLDRSPGDTVGRCQAAACASTSS